MDDPTAGRWDVDAGLQRPAAEPITLTTIAWRIAHITDVLAQERNEPTVELAIARLERGVPDLAGLSRPGC